MIKVGMQECLSGRLVGAWIGTDGGDPDTWTVTRSYHCMWRLFVRYRTRDRTAITSFSSFDTPSNLAPLKSDKGFGKSRFQLKVRWAQSRHSTNNITHFWVEQWRYLRQHPIFNNYRITLQQGCWWGSLIVHWYTQEWENLRREKSLNHPGCSVHFESAERLAWWWSHILWNGRA